VGNPRGGHLSRPLLLLRPKERKFLGGDHHGLRARAAAPPTSREASARKLVRSRHFGAGAFSEERRAEEQRGGCAARTGRRFATASRREAGRASRERRTFRAVRLRGCARLQGSLVRVGVTCSALRRTSCDFAFASASESPFNAAVPTRFRQRKYAPYPRGPSRRAFASVASASTRRSPPAFPIAREAGARRLARRCHVPGAPSTSEHAAEPAIGGRQAARRPKAEHGGFGAEKKDGGYRFRLTTYARECARVSRARRFRAVATRTSLLRELSRARRFEKRSRRRTRASRAQARTKFRVLHKVA